jgi:molecular chaperone DnaK (HSP70)
MVRRIGVDFGTANTVVAEWDDGTSSGRALELGALDVVRPSRRGLSQRVIPSLIRYELDDATLRTRLGAQVLSEPESETGPSLTFRNTKSQVSGRAVDVPAFLGTHALSGKQAASDFLSSVMQAALLAVNDPSTEFVLTAPVEAFDRYSEWLVEVAEAVGTGRIRITDEATAAAVGYSARMRPGDAFMVIDFGAGTLDVAVVRIEEPDKASSGSVRSIAKGGIDLGGTHMDMLIAEHLLAEMMSIPMGEAETALLRGQLVREAEKAKVALSDNYVTTIEFNHPTTGAVVERELSRAEMEDILDKGGVLGRFGQLVNKVMGDATQRGYDENSLTNVFLVGGSTLVPAIARFVHQRFDPGIVHSDRPLEAVAVGAAAQAGGMELFDHIQHDYAIRHVNSGSGDYEFTTLVAAGTEYPTEEPIASFGVKGIRDGQTHLGLAIFEMAHAIYREASSELELVFQPDGSARTLSVTPQRKLENSRVWLNEGNPTFLEADPPAKAGIERFRLEFRIDDRKRLTVSAFDVERREWVLDHHPVVRLS